MLEAVQKLADCAKRRMRGSWKDAPNLAETVDESVEYIANHLCEQWNRCDCWPTDQHLVRHVRTALAAMEADAGVVCGYSVRIANTIRALRQ